MKPPGFPKGRDEKRLSELLAYYETQSEEETVAEDEAISLDPGQTVMEVPPVQARTGGTRAHRQTRGSCLNSQGRFAACPRRRRDSAETSGYREGKRIMSTTIVLATVLLLLVVLAGDALRFRFRQKEMQKHDRVLFPFCQLRRAVMRFLYINVIENTNSLSPEEYKSVRQLLHGLDATIHNYNRHKTLMFNVRKIAIHLKMYRKISKAALETPDHPEIREFQERIRRLLVAAFLAYTPLIRWELAFHLIVFSYRMGKQGGARRREAEYIIRNAEKVRSDARHCNVSLGCA